MSFSSLLLEAARNSLEAGAGRIEIILDSRDGGTEVIVKDDGKFEVPSDPFRSGASTKGSGRGRGLALIAKESEGRAALERKGTSTVLSCSLPYVLDADSAASVLPAVFNLGMDTVVRRRREGAEVYSITSSELAGLGIESDTAKGYMAIGRMVMAKERIGAE